jgi:hypothetical protein
MIFRNKKNAPIAKHLVFQKKIKNNGLNNFLGNVSATLNDASNPPRHRGTEVC